MSLKRVIALTVCLVDCSVNNFSEMSAVRSGLLHFLSFSCFKQSGPKRKVSLILMKLEHGYSSKIPHYVLGTVYTELEFIIEFVILMKGNLFVDHAL